MRFAGDIQQVLRLYKQARDHFYGVTYDIPHHMQDGTSWDEDHRQENLRLIGEIEKVINEIRESDESGRNVVKLIESFARVDKLIENLRKAQTWGGARDDWDLTGKQWGDVEGKLTQIMESSQEVIDASVEMREIYDRFIALPSISFSSISTGDYVMIQGMKVFRVDRMFKRTAHVTTMFSVYESDGDPGHKRSLVSDYIEYVRIVDAEGAERLAELYPLVMNTRS